MISRNRTWVWLALLAVVAALFATVFAVRIAFDKKSETKRQLEHENITKAYSNALRVGTTRELVEAYLRSHGKEFYQECCFSGHTNIWADLVRIGQGAKPWYCSEVNAYVVFVFDGPARRVDAAMSSDKLVDVELIERGEGCL